MLDFTQNLHKLITESIGDLDELNLKRWFDFWLKPIIANDPAASKILLTFEVVKSDKRIINFQLFLPSLNLNTWYTLYKILLKVRDIFKSVTLCHPSVGGNPAANTISSKKAKILSQWFNASLSQVQDESQNVDKIPIRATILSSLLVFPYMTLYVCTYFVNLVTTSHFFGECSKKLDRFTNKLLSHLQNGLAFRYSSRKIWSKLAPDRLQSGDAESDGPNSLECYQVIIRVKDAKIFIVQWKPLNVVTG